MTNLFSGIYKDKIVLVTGHTGFKGSWLSLWLDKMGAKVVGYSQNPPTKPNHFELLNLDIVSVIGDIRDAKKLDAVFEKYKPDIVFHLAAQPLVRLSYENPIETYETNVIGTLKVFEACKKHKVKAIVNITSDKAYANKEQIWGYKESDRMGGYDPYSSSKGCAEILSASYRNSYFNIDEYKKTHKTLLATCRAGNVVGGGDWAQDRLMSDIVKSASEKSTTIIRNPKATRPWQHVLEPLSGYLLVGQKLLESQKEFGCAWNFGSCDADNLKVEKFIQKAKKDWKNIEYKVERNEQDPHEANLLKLDSTKVKTFLKWQSVWNGDKAIKRAVKWYKAYYEKDEILTYKDLKRYIKDAKKKNIEWAV